MGSDKENRKPEEKKSHRVIDRRSSSKEKAAPEKEKPQKSEVGEKGKEIPGKEEIREGKVDFTSFLLSLYSSVLVNLGEVPDPLSGKTESNLEMARQTIDILSVLREKTDGNLTQEEQQLLENVIPDLKLRYLKLIKYLT